MNKKIILLALAALLAHSFSLAQPLYPNEENKRSDTIDILNIAINLEITDFSGKIIRGHSVVRFSPKMNGVNNLNLDLLGMTIDSITSATPLTYSYNDTLIRIAFTQSFNTGDIVEVTIFYHGKPKVDASGFGGFIFQSGIAYNLGIAFIDKPHNAGRYWFPCFDNFVERCTYDLNFITKDSHFAASNGYLHSDQPVPGGKHLWKWKMEQPVPSYLVMVAVGPYETVKLTYNGMAGTIPIRYYAKQNDTASVKNKFDVLPDAMDAFEMAFGPYRFNKIGYTMVPFTGGAMEHASNITYPLSLISNETLMAHELSHQWWGNFSTCETPEDMWLNEGMASFCEVLFLEYTYSWEEARRQLKNVLFDVLKNAHIRDGGYLAISGVPHELTYGTHVYDKGALVAQNLREFLGYQNFYQGTSMFLEDRAFNSMNSEQFRDSLTSYTGINTTGFFNEWVFNGGFPDFVIDSFLVTPVGSAFEVTLFVKQKLNHAPGYFHNLPLEIGYYDQQMQMVTKRNIVDGPYSILKDTLPFRPEMISLNTNNRLCYAATDNIKVIAAPGIKMFDHGMMKLTVQSVIDSALVKIVHHWTAPDPIKPFGSKPYRLSDTRFWEVAGIGMNNLTATAEIIYSGKSSNGYLDSSLVNITEDSLVLLYRKDAGETWDIYPFYTKNMLGNPSNGFGILQLSKLLPGQYTLANKDHAVLSTGFVPKGEIRSLDIYPNPSGQTVNIVLPGRKQSGTVEVYSVNGQRVMSIKVRETDSVRFNSRSLPQGTYVIRYISQGNIYQGKFIKSL